MFIYMGGTYRVVEESGRLGLHRPYYDKKKYAALTPTQADAMYGRLDAKVKAYLQEFRVPQQLVERMFATSSDDVYWLSRSEIDDLGRMPQWLDEQVLARCGQPQDSSDNRWINCMNKLVRKEKIQGIDQLVGPNATPIWKEARDMFLSPRD